jgi:hypothetical protein
VTYYKANLRNRDSNEQAAAKYLFEELRKKFIAYAFEASTLRNWDSTPEEIEKVERRQTGPDEDIKQLERWINAFDGNRMVAMADDWKTKLASRAMSLAPAIIPTSSTTKDPTTTETEENNLR